MIYFFIGTDRKKALAALNAHVKKLSKKTTSVVRVSDASQLADLHAALAGAGMFDGDRLVILNGVCGSEDMRTHLEKSLPAMKASSETLFVFEEKPDTATRKMIEKYAEDTQRFDAAKEKGRDDFFKTAYALLAKDKKTRWVALQREFAEGKAPEAVHGTMFWRAKDIFMKARDETTKEQGKKLLAALAELPHEARRRGEELEYALEHFVLSGV